MPVDFKVRPTVNGVNVALLSELGGGVSGSYNFTPTSAFERRRITDSNVLSTSKIVGKILRPDQSEVNDYGWAYDFNIVKVANGYFDINVETTILGESADQEVITTVIESNLSNYSKNPNSGFVLNQTFIVYQATPFYAPESGYINRLTFRYASDIGNPLVFADIYNDASGVPGSSLGSSVKVAAPAFNQDLTLVCSPAIPISAGKNWIVWKAIGTQGSDQYQVIQLPSSGVATPDSSYLFRSDDLTWHSNNDGGLQYSLGINYSQPNFWETPTLFYKIL